MAGITEIGADRGVDPQSQPIFGILLLRSRELGIKWQAPARGSTRNLIPGVTTPLPV